MVCDRVAMQSYGRLRQSTPIGYTGRVQGDWEHIRLAPMKHINSNPNKVMRWLEHGTAAHGPKTAKALFVPLNQRATTAGPRGVMSANAQARDRGTTVRYRDPASGRYAVRPPVVLPFTFGVDFIWARRVRGIRARHIARDEQITVAAELRSQLVTMLSDTLRL